MSLHLTPFWGLFFRVFFGETQKYFEIFFRALSMLS